MKKNHEVVGVVIDAIQQNDTLKFLSAILECTIKDFDKITYNENSTVEDYLSTAMQTILWSQRQHLNWLLKQRS